jgi:hypothetical protein
MISGRDYDCLEQLVEKFADTLEKFSLYLAHFRNGGIDRCFNGHRLATLCKKLSHLRSLHFTILGQLIEPPSKQILSDFIQAFRTPFWLDGPLGRIRVCLDYHQAFGFVQIFSLPYTYSDATLYHTIDLIDALFNTEEETPDDLSVALQPLWSDMRWLLISLVENQKIPTSFLRALQCPSSQSESIIIFPYKCFMFSYGRCR